MVQRHVTLLSAIEAVGEYQASIASGSIGWFSLVYLNNTHTMSPLGPVRKPNKPYPIH